MLLHEEPKKISERSKTMSNKNVRQESDVKMTEKRIPRQWNKTDKKHFKRTCGYGILIAAIITCIFISCFSCSSKMDPFIKEQEDKKDRQYWMTKVNSTTWHAYINQDTDGCLPNLDSPLTLKITVENKKMKAEFYDSDCPDITIYWGYMTLDVSSGLINLNSGEIINYHFSENPDHSNQLITMELSSGKTIYYMID